VVPDLVTGPKEPVDIIPVNEFDRGQVKHFAAEPSNGGGVALLDSTRTDVEAARDSVRLQHFRRTSAVLEPVVEADRDVRSVYVTPRQPFDRLARRHELLTAGEELLDEQAKVRLLVCEDVVQVQKLYAWRSERLVQTATQARGPCKCRERRVATHRPSCSRPEPLVLVDERRTQRCPLILLE
jgi:hypothetical protein